MGSAFFHGFCSGTVQFTRSLTAMLSSFDIGQAHTLKVSVDADLVAGFARLSGDTAALHTDEVFARASGFDGTLVHGALLVAFVSRLIGMEFPGPGAILQRIDLSFRNPCYTPCDLHIRATVRQFSEAVQSLVLDIGITDGSGRIVATGKTWHGILRPVVM